ncbi:MAG: AAA family ATPase, partial [Rhodoglobus sp.]
MIGLPDGRVSPLLVGRDEVLALALRRWEAAGEGAGHLLLVAGESGIGKTRLLRELAERLGHDARTFSAGAFPRETDAAGAVLLNLADELQRTGLRDVADAIRARLLDNDQTAGDPARRRRMLVGDLAQTLLDLLTEQRTLLRLEDLHWADELSLDVLEHLAPAVRHTTSVLVATYRSDELYPRSALRRWRARLLEQRLAEEARLGRLGAADTAKVVEAITGELPSSEFVELLQLRSDGIPLHIEELIASGAAVPDTVTDAVTARVSELGESTRSIVDAASVIGRAFDIDILETITAESADRIDSALREAGEHHIVLARGDGQLYGFRHSLICDVVYDSIPLHRRRALHAAVAAAADSVGFSRAYVSEHYERANEPAAAFGHAMTAAGEAARVSAHREAAELYRRAQRTAPADLDPVSRAELHENLAFELAATDDNEGAAANLVAAMDLWRR